MAKNFLEPKVDILLFEGNDVIVTSGCPVAPGSQTAMDEGL